jgi:hypothetical protein
MGTRSASALGRLAMLLTATLVTCVSVGCQSTPVSYTQPGFVAMLTDGVTIYGEQEGWAITGSDPAPPPFTGRFLPFDPTQDGTIDWYQRAIDHGGAQRVHVAYPGLKRPLYGVLALCPIDDSTTESSVKRAYRIEVPASYVQQARGAMISVVYQPYKIRSGGGSGGVFAIFAVGKTEGEASGGPSRASWILWLSDAPFAGHDRNWTVPASAGEGQGE